ncbi:hypothetical protein J2T13_001899 [Paenibacillus sp. DS2015]|uniref:hypothetical protein n=1 Tax=Paenibacillus sp. DS2015 TaxID=3373917 RepID=UPI003D24B358
MSKGRVWNQGKRNGGPPKASKGNVPTKPIEIIGADQHIEVVLAEIKSEIDNPINSVKPMKRENGVQKSVREIRKEAKAKNNNSSEEGSSGL